MWGSTLIDEAGYIPFSAESAQLLFQVFSDRYEKASLIVTSNLPFAQWTSTFGDVALTAALLDRLTHHCSIHEFDWESLRLSDSLRNNKLKKKTGHRPVTPPDYVRESCNLTQMDSEPREFHGALRN